MQRIGSDDRKSLRTCGGEGRVREPATVKVSIPKGVDDGTRLCSRGRGDAGLMGGPAADLYVFVQVKDHELFERDGDDLFMNSPSLYFGDPRGFY